jgi:hypothetical protein
MDSAPPVTLDEDAPASPDVVEVDAAVVTSPYGEGRTRPAGLGWGETVGEANGMAPPVGPVPPAKKLCKQCRGSGWIEFDIAKGVASAE